jgi:hypothetical protein
MLTKEQIEDLFGENNLSYISTQTSIKDERDKRLMELYDLREHASHAFDIKLSFRDIIVAASSGILLGLANALFKDFVPKSGPLRHRHGTTKVPIDYGIPKPPGFKGSAHDLHRQLGPGHDLFRFKDALSLMRGETKDFNLWGDTATGILGHELKIGNMKLDQFRSLGGFNIPNDPKSELVNHLIIDFFTRRSLPIPGTSKIADQSPEMARIMMGMYKDGLNLKTALGNFIGYTIVQLIIHGYTFLYKAVPESGFSFKDININSLKNLFATYIKSINNNEFHGMMMIAHGSSFLVDTIVTTSSKSCAGLFQLNYLSLMAFCQHLLQYLIQSNKEYKKLLNDAREKSSEVDSLNSEWTSNFNAAFIRNFNSDSFLKLLDEDQWLKQRQTFNDSVDKIKDNNQKMKGLMKKIKDDPS